MKRVVLLIASLGAGVIGLPACRDQQAGASTVAQAGARPAPGSERPRVEPGGGRVLPRWKTAGERRAERLWLRAREAGQPLSDSYDDYRGANLGKFVVTSPPSGAIPFRPAAEHEPSQAYLLSWTQGLPPGIDAYYQGIVKSLWGKVPVVMTYADASHRSWLEARLVAGGIAPLELADSSRIVWWQHSVDSIWARDYGPLGIVTASSPAKLAFVDYRYYHTRVHDDEVPADLAKQWGVNVYRPDLDFEGGNFMASSDGICFASKGVLWTNPQLTQAAVEDLFRQYLGCKKVIFPTPLEGEPTSHLDMFAKLGPDGTAMVGQYSAAQDPKNATILDDDAALIATAVPGSGTIKVVRIPMPDKGTDVYGTIWRTYLNSQALAGQSSKTVLIPTYSDETSKEAAALQVYSAVFAGWAAVKLDSAAVIPWGGAAHCLLMQIPAGVRAKMEADPAPLCGSQLTCARPVGCAGITATGCCEGEVLKYCHGGQLISVECSSEPKCGWDPALAWYDCKTSGGPDPTGKMQRSCSALNPDLGAALVDLATTKDTGPGCGGIPPVGCCDGETLKWCEAGTVQTLDCLPGPRCGWNAAERYYDCATAGAADPAGQSKACVTAAGGDLGGQEDRPVLVARDRAASARPDRATARDIAVRADRASSPSTKSGDSGGCSCRLAAEERSSRLLLLLVLGALPICRRRR